MANDRIARLDLSSIILPEHLKHLQMMFSEAHFNYLLGNQGAAAIMCRALIEAALKDRIPGEFSLKDRIDKARSMGVLDDEYKNHATGIREIGNQAAHGHSQFSNCRDEQIEKVLVNTRVILQYFYGNERGFQQNKND